MSLRCRGVGGGLGGDSRNATEAVPGERDSLGNAFRGVPACDALLGSAACRIQS